MPVPPDGDTVKLVGVPPLQSVCVAGEGDAAVGCGLTVITWLALAVQPLPPSVTVTA